LLLKLTSQDEAALHLRTGQVEQLVDPVLNSIIAGISRLVDKLVPELGTALIQDVALLT
jgi:hypothetical protein